MTSWFVGTPKVRSLGFVATMHGGAGGTSKSTPTSSRLGVACVSVLPKSPRNRMYRWPLWPLQIVAPTVV